MTADHDIPSKEKLLELDGFCEKLGIAFEHHGKQHYQKVGLFHKRTKDLNSQQLRDSEKRLLCKAQGVTLIEIPQFDMNIDVEELRGTILNSLISSGYDVQNVHWSRNIDLTSVYIDEELLKAQDFAIKKGGKCLSEGFISDLRSMEWKCRNGHRWKQSFKRLKMKNGEWCPECSKLIEGHSRVAYTIDDMENLAKGKNGRCLSRDYINCKTSLLWECEEGHQWWANPSNIRQGTWCPTCSIKIGASKRIGEKHWTKKKSD